MATNEHIFNCSFIDGSAVYGSDVARAAALRTFVKGELKTSQKRLNLPYNFDGLANAGGDQNTSFVAGKRLVNFTSSNATM